LHKSTASRLSQSIHIDGSLDDLVIDQAYIVEALEQRQDGGLWLYIHTVDANDYPYPYPLEYFQILDSSFPDSWTSKGLAKKGLFRVSFREWVNDDHFYEKLVDEDQRAVGVYSKNRGK
jgi:hypothetical protein